MEQIILVSIALILLWCFIFFLGILRGKSLGSELAGSVIERRIAQGVPKRTVVAPEPLALNQPARPASFISKAQETANPGKPYTIQIATYKKRDLAEKEVVTLRHSGYYSTLIFSGGYYQVCVGQYATKEEAKKDLKILSARYKGPYLRRR